MKYLSAIVTFSLLGCSYYSQLDQRVFGDFDDITVCGDIPEIVAPSPEEYKVLPIKLIPEALGRLERQVQTNSAEAQDFFNQGLQLRYAFAVNQAISSFREATKLDSTSAMLFWGEAWALGSYLNGHMRDNKAPLAYRAIQKAKSLVNDKTNEVDKALIEAMSVRYIEDYVYKERRHRDSLYANAMKEVYERFPKDLDVATLYADALFLLEPRGGTREMDNPRLMIIHDLLEGVLAKNIEHPGACHLYIHATESTNQPGLAESCADYLGNTIPGASHINHMPSHTYNEIGRWGDGVKANQQASQTDKLARDGGDAFAIYPGHNLHMLLYAACYDGQGAVAMQAGRDYNKIQNSTVHHALTAIRFGRFEDVLELDRPKKQEIEQGIWDFCYGYAKLKLGEPDIAEVYLNRVIGLADTTKRQFRFQAGGPILNALASILEGEMQWIAGEKEMAIATFKKGVEYEDSHLYSEPEPYPFSVRHWLGAAQLELKDWSGAEITYRDEIADHPHNGWSLYGLKKALKFQNKPYADIEKDLMQSWARADVLISSSRF